MSPPPPPPPPLARALAAVMETPAGVLRPLCVTVQLHGGEPAGGEKSSQDQLREARGKGEEVQGDVRRHFLREKGACRGPEGRGRKPREREERRIPEEGRRCKSERQESK